MNKRIAFTMKLFAGKEEEYKKRHENIWPELVQLLIQVGISNYSIFLDESTNLLFGVLDYENAESIDSLPSSVVMIKWWEYMKDIMETNEDNSPVSIPLKEVFFMP